MISIVVGREVPSAAGIVAFAGARIPIAIAPSAVVWKIACANLGHPWLKLAVQQPKLGARPYFSASSPSCFHTCGWSCFAAISFTA